MSQRKLERSRLLFRTDLPSGFHTLGWMRLKSVEMMKYGRCEFPRKHPCGSVSFSSSPSEKQQMILCEELLWQIVEIELDIPDACGFLALDREESQKQYLKIHTTG